MSTWPSTVAFALAFPLLGCVGDVPAGSDSGADSGTDSAPVDAQPPQDSASNDADAQPLTPVPATLQGVVLWLDAQQASTIQATQGKVTRWLDRSAFQHDAIAEAAHEPVLAMDPAKSLPYVRFASAAMTLSGQPSDASSQLGGTGDFLIEIVMMNTSNQSIVFHNVSTAAPGTGFNIGLVSGENQVFAALAYNNGLMRDPASTMDGKLRLFGVQRTANGTTFAIRNNGATAATNSVGAVDLSNGEPWRLGAYGTTVGSPQYMTGAIGEIVVVKGTISGPDQAALEAYLMAHWKLP